MSTSISRRRFVPVAAALLTMLMGLSFGASSAQAGVALATSPDIPRPNGPVTVGQTNVPSRLTIINNSTESQETLNVTLSNITLVPSCGIIASVDCPAAFFDPDVFSLSATGTGLAGTACAGTTFTITNIDQAQDKYLFTPSVPVVLGPSLTGGLAARCVIDFTVNVLKVPTIDARPADPGVQTNELAGANGTASDGQTGQGTGTNFTTVNRATPALATTATASATVNGTISDQATVSGRVNPVAGGTVTFNLYGPADPTCAGAPVFSSTVPLPTATNTVTSASFTPTSPGTYRWVAFYSGDANNAPVTGLCDTPGENTVVNQATPSIVTQASGPVTVGTAITDTATVSGRVLPQAGATVTFTLFGPNNATCSGAPIFTSTVGMPTATNSVTSGPFTPTAPGSYRWIAAYSGDANNAAVTGACNDANELTVVNQATPSIVTQASGPVTVGTPITDTATVSGRVLPQAGATVTFTLFGPNNATCTGAPIFTSTVGMPTATNSVTSAAFTPTSPGSYRWIAAYSGDANNAAVTGACNDANELTVVNQATPSIVTQASGPVTVGTPITDTATVSGRVLPQAGGTVTFTLFGPNNATCTGAPIFTSTVGMPTATNSVTSGPFTPTAPGSYRWIAAYSGDANNAAVTGACNDANELTVVNQATPSIVTQASGPVTVGTPITDTATVSGRVLPQAGATVTFSLYGPDNATCTGAPIFSSTVGMPTATNSVTSGPFTPTAPGSYRWIAAYSGDANNAAVTGACNDANELTVVNQATPSIVTQASGPVTVGTPITDTATVSGRVLPQAGATVTFTLFGPNNATCTGAPIFTSTVGMPTATNTVTSAAFTPTAPGSYRWIAAYSGDANNAAVTGACNDANELTVVNQATPTIVTQASGPVTVGTPITDTATVSGRVNPLAGATVTFSLYGPDNATCTGAPIFTSTVGMPTATNSVTSGPFTPTAPGSYRWIAAYSGDANNAAVTGACNDANELTVVNQATPTITTQASSATTVGGTLTDNATVSGRQLPQAGGTVTFSLYGPNDANCTGAAIFTSTVTLPTATNTVTSAPYTPTAPGTYRWIASYSGDANNAAVTGACNDANESTTVTQAGPAITTNASAATTVGGTLTDNATVTGRSNPLAGATVRFDLYGPNDATCSGTPIFTSTVALPTDTNTVTSGQFTPTAPGTYRWIAAYSGDANNLPATGACNDANENVVVNQAAPTIATTASANTVVGGTLTDNATVTGRSNPQAGATVTFNLYGPDNATCTGAPVFTSTVPYPVAGGSVTSGAYTPTAPGVYRWIATYSGDANNAPVSGACGDANENVTVALVQPTIATDASDDITIGGDLTDTATVSGRVSPLAGATITFRAYGPNDADCTGPAAYESVVPYPVAGGTVTSGVFTPTAAGTYRWRATYSGDANNLPVTGACNAPNENVVVNPATPAIATDASDDIVLGGQVTDTAVVTGRVNPLAGATIRFQAFGPNDANCTGAVAFESVVPYPVAGGMVTSEPFVPTAAGTYRWRARYSGDANNAAVEGPCNAPNENVIVTTPAAPPPPVAPPPPPPPPPPPAQVLPVSEVPSGTAKAVGPTGCVTTNFNVQVYGRQIEKVVFYLDGKKIRTLTAPNRGTRYVLPVRPNTLRRGTHRVLAVTYFSKASGTKSRTLRVVFQRCGRVAVQPRFTG